MGVIDLLIRVSKTNGRIESAESTITIGQQRDGMVEAIKAKGHTPGIEIQMLDQSGFDIAKSSAYPTILERKRTGKSEGAAVMYADRLSRNWRQVGAFYEELEEEGGEFIIAGMPGVDYRTADGRLILGMMHVAGETVTMMAKARGNLIADEVVKNGVPNRAPYGYRRNWDEEHGRKYVEEFNGRVHFAKALVPDPATAPVVKRIFKLREDGHSYAEICAELNGESIPAPGGGAWVFSSVRQTLRNETYLGHVILGKTRRKDNAHEPLVSLSQFRRVKSTRKVKRTGLMVAGIAGSLVVCSGCKHPMRVIGGGDTAKRRRRLSYACPRLMSTGPCPRPVAITKDVADDYVEELLAELLEQTEGVDIVASAREIERARREWQAAQDEREAFVLLSSALEAADFTAGYEQRKSRESELELRYEELLSEASEANGLPTSASAYRALDFESRRRVARRVIDSLVVSPPLSRSSFADPAERLEVRLHGTRQVTDSLA